VITVDRDFSVHNAVAIIGDRIMAVGNDDQMRRSPDRRRG
jgi:predicted amidohydrolase YtcJ